MNDISTITEIADWSRLPSKPLVSVHMLAYRHERFIAQSIEGVLAQRCDFPFELIIGEDCSPDRTREIAESYQQRFPDKIRILTSSVNMGAYENGKRFQRVVRGPFIALCEGDDYWHDPNKLQRQVETMTASDDITLCHTDYDRLTGRKLQRNCHRAQSSPHLAMGDAYKSLLHRWSVMTATAMYRTDIVHAFNASRFNRKDWPFGDYNLALFAATRGRVAYLPISTAVWRKVTGSATNGGATRTLRMRLASLACREVFMEAFPVDDATRKACLCFANRNVMNAALHACDRMEFDAARERLLALDCTLPRFDDWLRRTALQLRFPAHAYRALRATLLRIRADRL